MKYAVYDPTSPIDMFEDRLVFFGAKVILKLKISLLSMSNDPSIYGSPIKAYKRKTNYKNISSATKISRSYEPYLALEYPGDNNTKEFVMIPVCSIRYMVNKIDPWINNLTNNIKNINMLPNMKGLSLYPTKKERLDLYPDIFETKNGEKDIGIRMVMNNKFTCICHIDKLNSFLYIMAQTDLYSVASSAISALMPSILENEEPKDFTSKGSTNSMLVEDEPEETTTFAKISKPITKNDRKKSFFDD